jgi:hypothetical protein
MEDAETYQVQVKSIVESRLLLSDPDPVTPMVLAVSQLLRDELNQLASSYDSAFDSGFEQLEKDSNWQKLEPEQRNALLSRQGLTNSQKPEIKVQCDSDIIATMSKISIASLRDRVIAMPSRFQQVQQDAAKLMEPQVTFVSLPRRTLKSAEDVQQWISEVQQQLIEKLKSGPVGIQ